MTTPPTYSNTDLIEQLRTDARAARREPPPALRDIVHERIRAVPRTAHRDESVRVTPFAAARYRPVAALAASIVLAGALAVLFHKAPSNPQPSAAPGGAHVEHPALIEPFRALVRVDRNEMPSPLADEADRMLADVAHAARTLVARLPMRGRIDVSID